MLCFPFSHPQSFKNNIEFKDHKNGLRSNGGLSMYNNGKQRKIILDLAVSLDGFIEGPKGEIDWCIMEPDMKFTRSEERRVGKECNNGWWTSHEKKKA